MRDVWFAIPAYSGQVHIPTMRSIIADLLLLTNEGINVSLLDECGNALIPDARDLMVTKFLDGPGTDLVFIDNDVFWEYGAILELIKKPVDLVVGVYPQRRDPIDFSVRWRADQGELWSDIDTGLLEAACIPAGFMKMSRAMLEKMTEHYRDSLEYYCEIAPKKTTVALFDRYWLQDAAEVEGRKVSVKLGEDFSFCQRWLDLGGKTWIQPWLKMGHIGYKSFVGCFGEWMQNKLPAEQEEKAA